MASTGRPVQQVHIAPRSGGAVRVKKGQRVKVTDIQGKQVCDFFAVNPNNAAEFLSGTYTRSSTGYMRPQVGQPLYNNQRKQIMVLEEDTVKRHDMLYAPCDSIRYEVDYGLKGHANCKDNVLKALAEFNLHPPVTPEVVNFFQNSGPDENENMVINEPLSKAGDYVVVRALEDLIVAVSACPQDQNPANGFNPTDLKLEVYE